MQFFPFQVVWHDGVRELPNLWQWLVEHDNGTGSNQKEINSRQFNIDYILVTSSSIIVVDKPLPRIGKFTNAIMPDNLKKKHL